MPNNNAFRHQTHQPALPGADLVFLCPPAPEGYASDVYSDRLATAGKRLAAEQVAAIYLIHGTLVGTDASGLIGVLGRFLPDWASSLGQQRKNIADLIMGEWANYNQEFEETLREGVNAGLRSPIAVHRFLWSSENNHNGRANAAVKLIDDLHSQSFSAGQRVQLWGHSHGGNVLALMSNLLGGSLRSRAAFFRAAKPIYRRADRSIDLPAWARVRELLRQDGNPLEHLQLDLVTFGTPVRYGWDSTAYARLLHFIYHRKTKGLPDHLAPFPPTLQQIYEATAGDFIQQFFVAGTNFPVNLLAWRKWRAERKLQKLLQSGHGRSDLWSRLNTGSRIPDEGTALLVDYSMGDPVAAKSVAGHAIYTCRNWLPFHLETILDQVLTGG